ncbi:MAG: hypothetical protein LBG83_04660 [Oscillospiraceae bacterium]|jgi:hypothetical protein|nr:hypothetical protein [Oscillospiraceae bacterium]
MKRILAIALTFALALTLFAGCGKTAGENEPTTAADYTNPIIEDPTDPFADNGNTYGDLTKDILALLESDSFHRQTVEETEGAGKQTTDFYQKDGMTATVSESSAGKSRIVTKEGKSYTILDADKTVMIAVIPAPPINDEGAGPNTIFKETGKAEFNGEELPYDVYDFDGANVTYFVKDGQLAGIRTERGGETTEVIYTAFDTNIPADIFDIPADYTKMEV